MNQLQQMRDDFDARLLALATELVNETVAAEGQPTRHFQRVLDEAREAENRVLVEAEPKASRAA